MEKTKKSFSIFIIFIRKLIFIYICIIGINSSNYKRITSKNLIMKKTNDKKELPENKNLRFALCTMGKEENQYLNEFVDYYIKLGINHIFIYDDNPPNYKQMSDSLDDKYKQNVTFYKNLSSSFIHQSTLYNYCYEKNKNIFDWFLMVDMDEFLYLVDDKSLKEYLSDKNFEKCDFIKFNWAITTDNNLIHYDNRTLFERFKPPFLMDKFVKSMIRGNISGLKYWIHSPLISPIKNISCINTGEQIFENKVIIESTKPINTKKAFLVHFRFKSTEEFVNKYKRGYRNWFGKRLKSFLEGNIEDYFNQNKITLEKINFIEKELQVNLLYYKIKYYFCKIILFNKLCLI